MLGGEPVLVAGLVDPDGRASVEDLGSGLCAGSESFAVCTASGIKGSVAVTVDSVGQAVVDVGGSAHPDPGVAVVVGVHELIREGPCSGQGSEPVREHGSVLHRLEQGPGVGVVVAEVGAGS